MPEAEPQGYAETTLVLTADGLFENGERQPVEAQWSITNGPLAGVSLEGGVLTVTNQAQEGQVRIQAVSGAVSARHSVTIKRASGSKTVVRIEQDGQDLPGLTLEIPAEGSLTHTLEAAVYDGYGALQQQPVQWFILSNPAPEGVQCTPGGRLTITDQALPGDVQLVVQCVGSLHGSDTLTVTLNAAEPPADSGSVEGAAPQPGTGTGGSPEPGTGSSIDSGREEPAEQPEAESQGQERPQGDIFPFTDVAEDSYCYEAVAWAARTGLARGTGQGVFSPDSLCTRAEVVTLLWRMAGSPAPEWENPFTDVAEDSYCRDAVVWAVQAGLTNGTGPETFSPAALCTRAQVVTFLWRAAGSPQPEGSEVFDDVAEDSIFAPAIRWASSSGVTRGIAENRFAPDRVCTRGETVTILFRSAR